MTNVIENIDHEESLLLLPLYVNQSLGKKDTLAVEKHLDNCTACQKEMAFERSLQNSISAHEDDVTEIARKNLLKFNAQLDQQLAKQSKIDAPAVKNVVRSANKYTNKNELPVQGQNSNNTRIVERILNYTRTLLSPGPAIGGALVVGCCAVVVVSMFYRSGDVGPTQSPLRGCEHIVKQHELRVVTSNTTGVSGKAKDILEEYFPDSDFTVEVRGDTGVVVNLTGDTCMVPLVVNDLEKLPLVNSVTLN